ncbi:DUF732 domain-containing protein [Mycolicibacter terrae]|uniref:DUF732 domain-containing protein n=2 Tax=Mycolicibacter TaxID=1073531 RepID=A0A1A2NRT6_MYCSD|nr:MULTISPECIES: DUF732 domain-containing protein [Mycolicibacter]OBH17803.1 hypothetical protein A5694_02930 [Mycolicibacter sinensis]OBI25235.1 hypothetical protein A5710_09925 [Mycolicibacter sinensis]RRR42539.1 DUF732 domain-containing protein [Mycolicibacter terrae]
MNKQLIATALSAVLAGFVVAPAPAAVADDPSNEDQAFFTDLEQEGLHPNYDKQVCGTIKCASLRDLLVQEGHAVCSALGSSPRLVPISVIANLEVSPDEARAIINAARQAYCPQLPDPYTPAV